MAKKRKGIRPLVRFEVFKRDGFTCQYCGASPPTAVLVVDHIRPVADGGNDDDINLVTSCQSCNQGKAARKLEKTPAPLSEMVATETERMRQSIEYEKLRMELTKIENDAVDDAVKSWKKWYGFSLDGREKSSVLMFVRRLGGSEVLSAMSTAAMASADDGRFRYFCGTCWSKIRVKEGVE